MDTNRVQDREVLPKQRDIKLVLSEKLRTLLVMWELYPILFITAFLRLYHIATTASYVDDDAVVFRLARDLFTHGLFPITSNRASLGNLNPPMVVYLFMIPASISGNPLWAEIMVGLFNSAAVLLTYFFTRRYFGRFAGTTAALLYATAVKAIMYSRNIWPQNLLPFFTILLMFFLFRGVVERRKGWIVPAVVLIAILAQLHASGLLMVIPFALALVFAYKTIRWSDILLSAIMVVVLFAPFLYWEHLNHWSDLHALITASKSSPAQTDTQAIDYYKQFLSPYVHSLDVNDHYFSWPTHPDSIMTRGILHYFKLPFFLELEGMWLLLHCSLFTALMLILIPQRKTQPEESICTVRQKNMLFGWWANLYATPSRQGLILLLSWQAALLILLRHSIALFPHYFIIFLPGQFILIGIFISKVIEFFRYHRPDCVKAVRYGSYLLVILITTAQLIGSTGALIDTLNDHFSPDPNPWWPGFNNLSSIQNVLTQADQLAQARHIHRIYIPVTYTTANPIRGLAEEMKTPVTTFDTHYCMILPDPSAGPAIFISDTANAIVNSLLARYTNATLISRVKHLDNPLFTLYVLTTKPQVSPALRSFTSDLQLLEQRAFTIPIPASRQQWLVTHWKLMNSTTPMPLTTNNFHVQIQSEGTNTSSPGFDFTCATTALRAGDQILLYLVMDQGKIPASIRVQASSYTSRPANYSLGPLTLTTFNTVDTPHKMLKTAGGGNSIPLPVSQGVGARN